MKTDSQKKSKKFKRPRKGNPSKSIEKVKQKRKTVTIIPKAATGTSNWDQLSQIIGYDVTTTKMEKLKQSTGNVSSDSNKYCKPKKKTLVNNENEDAARFASKSKGGNPDNVGERQLTKSTGIKEIGNSLSPVKSEKSCLNKPCGNGLQNGNAIPAKSIQPCLTATDIKNEVRWSKQVAMDCEMVGTGEHGAESMIARVSIVNRYGDCLYDVYVKPKDDITDYRTPVSGIRPSDLTDGKDLFTVQTEVLKILEGRVLVGHALKNDLDVLFISHPKLMIRDTARYRPFRQMFNGSTPSLKKLTAKVLGMEIQSGEHNSVEDANAAMQVYLMHKTDWEKSLKQKRKKFVTPSQKAST